MDFASIVLFLMVYYLRPQEWIGFLNNVHPVQLVMLMALFSLISREQKLAIKDFFRTPHDWIMTAYFAWTVFASPTPIDTFKSIESAILTYYVGVQCLNSLYRIKKLIAWWAAFIVIIALLAISSEYGFDPFGSYDRTHGLMKGRLVLHLSIFNNPNTLAHSIVPCIPMLFFLLFWKQIFMKAWIVLLLIPLWCIFLTQSKGAFLCSGVVLIATLCFGRPKIAQIVILVFASTMGWAALYQLPRMGELNKARSDAAIQGRIAAWTFGLQCMETRTFGIGLSNFEREFFRHGPLEYPEHPKKFWVKIGDQEVLKQIYRGHHYSKATHGAYNQNGAELGYTGLFLFVGAIYCCMKTVLVAKTTNTEEERIRRILFCIILSYAVSSWMVDFCYRPTFFMFAAATGAFHRYLRGLLPGQIASVPISDGNDGIPL